ncbi:MAG: histone deacetylase [Bacteroidia bacterium]|nr:histone deacetylase [Bacteroidia bacterium]
MFVTAWHSSYRLHLPDGHRFPMIKYELIPEQLLREGIIDKNHLFSPGIVPDPIIELTHCKSYWNSLKNLQLTEKETRAIGFPLHDELILRERILVQGTIDCATFALKNGIAFNTAGGTHHASFNRGEGFCLLNDQAIAANWLLFTKQAKKIMIVDLDVHQGNGTAQLFVGKPEVFTFSMHGKENYPLRKENSDRDIELITGINGYDYLAILKREFISAAIEFAPDFIFYNAGVDVLATDKYGKLNLSPEDCAERDRTVFEFCRAQKIPVTVCMGGGYSPNISDIVNAHVNTFKMAAGIYE